MSLSPECVFCDPEIFIDEGRLIREEELYFSIVSRPWFRYGHCLVVPKRHVEKLSELTEAEAGGMILEAGRLEDLVDNDIGSGMFQKFHPNKTQDEIKQDHLHLHVAPREVEAELFPVPLRYRDFYKGGLDIQQQLATELRQ